MDMKHTFGAEIEKELAKIGFDLKGHYPRLSTRFYTLDVDLDQSKVGIWYGPEQDKLASVKLYATDVARELQKQHEKITAHRLDDREFMKTLITATGYEKRASIPDIVSDFAERNVYGTKSKKWTKIFLSYDLYRLSERDVDDVRMSLVTATRAYTQRKSDFLWVPPGTYISHIKFTKIHPTGSEVRRSIDAAVQR